MSEVHEFTVTDIVGEQKSLSEYRGKVLLIVNVASQCGFTPQYAGLQALYERYRDRGLEVLGFPCNQFGHQEPGDEAAIKDFCDTRFRVTFPMFHKIDVNGAKTDPLYAHLKAKAPGVLGSKSIKWNFTKFLVSRDGQRVVRFATRTKPDELAPDIEKLLDEPAS
jgi:glutathione peroxidase